MALHQITVLGAAAFQRQRIAQRDFLAVIDVELTGYALLQIGRQGIPDDVAVVAAEQVSAVRYFSRTSAVNT